MRGKTLLVFDCFGVLMHEVSSNIFSKYYPNNAKEMKDHFCVPMDYGNVTLDEMLTALSLDIHVPFEELKKEWYSHIKCNLELLDAMKKLKKDASISLLSNAGNHFLEDCFEKYGIDISLFDYQFISYQIHKVKPNQDIYLHVMDNVPKSFQKIIMIDDNLVNLKVPSELGWDTLQFNWSKNDEMIDFLQKYVTE